MQSRFKTNPAAGYFLLTGISVAILPLLFHLPLWIALICYSLILWRLLYDTGKTRLPGKLIIFLLLTFVLVAVITHYHTIIGRNAGAALLSCLICLKLLELKSLRDVSVVVQLTFFAILTGFLFSQSLLVAASMLIAVILLLCSLMIFHHAKADYHSTTATEKSHLLYAARLVFYAIPLTIILFVLFPRINASLWSLPDDALQAKTGLSDKMSPGRVSRLSNSAEVAFRVQFDAAIPASQYRYWRGPVLWSFDGYNWTAPLDKKVILPAAEFTNKKDKVSYSITLEAHNANWLFALDLPAEVPVDAQLSSQMQLLTHTPVSKLRKYQLSSYLEYQLPLQKGQSLKPYLHVPRNTAPRARKWISELQLKHPTARDMAGAVLNHFEKNNFYYTRTPPPLLADPIDEFLFNTRRGYCEHYASTFTILMRLAGIPARVVTGYQGGEMNPLSNYMIIRQSDAHAWSEIYIADRGWLRVDPTSVIPVANIENPIDAVRIRPGLIIDASRYIDRQWYQKSMKQLRFAIDVVNNQWNQWVVGYNQTRQKSFLDFIGIPDINLYGIGYLLATVLSLVTLVIAYRVFSSSRIQHNPVQSIYQRFLKKSARYQMQKSPAEGALAFSQRLAVRFPGQKSELLNIAKIYNALRYDRPHYDRPRYDQSGKASLQDLRTAIRNIRFT